VAPHLSYAVSSTTASPASPRSLLAMGTFRRRYYRCILNFIERTESDTRVRWNGTVDSDLVCQDMFLPHSIPSTNNKTDMKCQDDRGELY